MVETNHTINHERIHMTPAELRTIRQGLGLTPRHIASRAGTHFNVVWRAESPATERPVSEKIATALTELAAEFDSEVAVAANDAIERGRIYRPATPEAFYATHPALSAWPERSIATC